MKKQNELVSVAGTEFITTKKAAGTIIAYQKHIKKKFKFRKSIRLSLEQALRDVLTEKLNKPGKTVSEKLALTAVSIVGDEFDDQSNPSKARNISKNTATIVISKFKKHFMTGIVRKRIYLLLALVFFAAGTLIASYIIQDRIDIKENFVYNSTTNVDYIDTTIGRVILDDWYQSDDFANTYPTLIENRVNSSQYFALATLLSVSLFFYLISVRNRQTKIVGLICLALVILWLTAIESDSSRFNNAFVRMNTTLDATAATPDRTISDIDVLEACESRINYVFGAQAGEVYYLLQNDGFVLEKELVTKNKNQEPTREQVCKAYNELRQNYDNENIVFQSYITDDEGINRPFDGAEHYGPNATSASRKYIFKYGFFVKD
jgi:hypothetical protein